MISSKITAIEHLIHGPAGELQVEVANPIGTPRGAWGIICHPHPIYGGTMHNKVVTTIAKSFQQLGLNTVRFNFRGVGKSVGKFDKGEGELDDLLAVINWVLHEKPNQKIWLAGFSFGAYVAMKAATKIPFETLTVVAPPVHHFDMQSLLPVMCRWILVQGEKDEVVAAKEVFAWAETREPPPVILKFPNATHFFHGQLIELRERLEQALLQITTQT